ncbi:MAG: hypothetical protein QGG83_04680, partial [Candidatus Woesearchaeota archaeon]|nr:hypothetical protein [Candidatus Woesearchaeota archaeon]
GGGTIGAFPDGALNVDGSIQEKQRVPCVADGAQFRCPLDNQLFNLEIDCTQACVEDISEEPINTNDLKVRFCDEDQRISEPFDFVVKDRLRKTEDVRNPIKDASISVGCGKYKECTLGGTDSSGILNSPVPFCLGTAYALAQADGFQPKIINLRSTKPKEPQTPTFLLEPIIDRQIQIRLIPLANLFHTKDIMVTNANQLLTFLGVVERIINASAPELTPTGPVGGTITRDQWASLLGEMDVIEIQLRAMISRHKPVKHYNAMNQEVVRQDTLIFQGVAESLTLQPLIDRFETIIPDLDLLTGVLDDTTSKAILSDMILRRKNANLLTPPEITPNAAAIQRSSAFVIPDNVQVAGTLNRALQPNEQPVPASGIQQTGDGLNEVQLIFGPYESRLQVILNKKLNLRTIGIAPAAPYEDSIMGGVNLKGATSFTVSDEMLLSDKPIILYAFLFDEFQTIEDLTMIGEVEEHSIRLGEFIEPQLAD